MPLQFHSILPILSVRANTVNKLEVEAHKSFAVVE